jgi:hypothetical protein
MRYYVCNERMAPFRLGPAPCSPLAGWSGSGLRAGAYYCLNRLKCQCHGKAGMRKRGGRSEREKKKKKKKEKKKGRGLKV